MKKVHKDYLFAILLLCLISILTLLDLFKDYSEGSETSHLLTEVLVVLACLFSIALFLRKIVGEKVLLSHTLDQTRNDLSYWKQKSSSLIKGLSIEIDEQFKSWSLSKSEKEIALLLIKGLSVKDIANIRCTAEKTVRVQTSSIYKKAKLANRYELSAFFLEDLLVPAGQDSAE